jgi:hypothetical protein
VVNPATGRVTGSVSSRSQGLNYAVRNPLGVVAVIAHVCRYLG